MRARGGSKRSRAWTGCRLLQLDVTDDASMRAAVERIEQEEGAVGVLVNNAGYSQSGAVESVPLDEARRQFETNVFGLARLTQLVLPGMRRQGWGRVVNVSSMGGRLTFPGGGWYHASKHAVEASDALLRGAGLRYRGRDRARCDPDELRRSGRRRSSRTTARSPVQRCRRCCRRPTRTLAILGSEGTPREAIEGRVADGRARGT